MSKTRQIKEPIQTDLLTATFPDEILLEIFSNLPLPVLAKLMRVRTKYYDLIKNEFLLTKLPVIQTFKNEYSTPFLSRLLFFSNANTHQKERSRINRLLHTEHLPLSLMSKLQKEIGLAHQQTTGPDGSAYTDLMKALRECQITLIRKLLEDETQTDKIYRLIEATDDIVLKMLPYDYQLDWILNLALLQSKRVPHILNAINFLQERISTKNLKDVPSDVLELMKERALKLRRHFIEKEHTTSSVSVILKDIHQLIKTKEKQENTQVQNAYLTQFTPFPRT